MLIYVGGEDPVEQPRTLERPTVRLLRRTVRA